MRRSLGTGILISLAVATAGFLTLGSPASAQSPTPVPISPVPTASAAASATPQPSAAATTGITSTRPRPILDGLLTTASGERVINDAVTTYESRGARGWQAATRAPFNPLSGYRAQLQRQGWKFVVDEPTRISAQRKGDWIAMTATDVGTLTKNQQWATVLAFAQLIPKALVP